MAKKFYELSQTERLATLQEQGKIDDSLFAEFTQMTLSQEIAEHLIENQISEVEVPLGVALNLQVNGQAYDVPLATEEPSVVAACNYGIKLSNLTGGFTAEMPKKQLRGQVVFYDVVETQKFVRLIEENRTQIFEVAAASYPSLVKRGGGLRGIEIRTFAEDESFVSVDLIVDPCDAMGANMVNTIAEGVARYIETLTDTPQLFSILSNYASEAVVRATCQIPVTAFAPGTAAKIEKASTFAQLDPYRAATHNKGMMNGVEAVVLATGNDTRAVSASIHAYASRDGQYRGLTQWQVENEQLVGVCELPLALGTVGGATKVLPKAQASLSLLNIQEAKELAQVVACVGLAQNLAALRALVTEGIQKGHMALQARALAITVGAKGDEVEQVAQALQGGVMNQETAATFLAQLRK